MAILFGIAIGLGLISILAEVFNSIALMSQYPLLVFMLDNAWLASPGVIILGLMVWMPDKEKILLYFGLLFGVFIPLAYGLITHLFLDGILGVQLATFLSLVISLGFGLINFGLVFIYLEEIGHWNTIFNPEY